MRWWRIEGGEEQSLQPLHRGGDPKSFYDSFTPAARRSHESLAKVPRNPPRLPTSPCSRSLRRPGCAGKAAWISNPASQRPATTPTAERKEGPCKSIVRAAMAEGVGLSALPISSLARARFESNGVRTRFLDNWFSPGPASLDPGENQWRREWDYRLCRSLRSLGLASSRTAFEPVSSIIGSLRGRLRSTPERTNGGGSGIRTHGSLHYTRFRIERLKPGSAIPP